MKNHSQFTLTAIAAITLLVGIPARADYMTSIAITPATGVVTLAPRWAISPGLAGFHLMSQDLSLGGGANQFYSIVGTTIPAGGSIYAFTRYIAGSGAATNHQDIGSKLTPDSYSALTSADPDIGYGAVNFYFIHHKSTGDYFSTIVPGSATSSAVTDRKPMSGPGGPATLGASGYFGLTFAASNLGYGLSRFYYLRTDSVTGYTKFGTLDPSLLGTSADQFDLGISGYNALAFTGSDVGYGTDKMYYLRLDPTTGFTVFGTLHPLTGRTADIANLGSVFNTLTFVPGDVGFGSGRFYTTGAVNPTWQSVSFAAIPDRALNQGSFTVAPSASSSLPIALTVLSGSATISSPVGGVFTVTPTASGLIILQATQAGQVSPTPYEQNMLRQSFMVSGAAARYDFNHDSQPDIIFKNSSTGEIGIWTMTGTNPTGWTVLPTVVPAWKIVANADFNGDGHCDILFKNSSTGEIGIWTMTNGVPNNWIVLPPVVPAWEIVTAADFNGDGQPDIVFKNSSTGEIGIWTMTGTNPTGWVVLPPVAPAWQIVAAADFNRDGYNDILFKNASTGEIGMWTMTGTNPTGWIVLPTVVPAWKIVTAADFSGDGHADILFKNSSTGEIGMWTMTGTNPTGWVVLPPVVPAWQIVNH